MRLMLILDRDLMPHRTEIEDDERLAITGSGHVKRSGPSGGSSLTKMDPPGSGITRRGEQYAGWKQLGFRQRRADTAARR